MNPYWSYALTVTALAVIWLAGRKSKWAWVLGVTAQLLWIAYAVATRQWGFIVSAIAHGALYGRNFVLWRRDEQRVSASEVRR